MCLTLGTCDSPEKRALNTSSSVLIICSKFCVYVLASKTGFDVRLLQASPDSFQLLRLCCQLQDQGLVILNTARHKLIKIKCMKQTDTTLFCIGVKNWFVDLYSQLACEYGGQENHHFHQISGIIKSGCSKIFFLSSSCGSSIFLATLLGTKSFLMKVTSITLGTGTPSKVAIPQQLLG